MYEGCFLLLLHDPALTAFQSAWDVVGLQHEVKCTLPMYKVCSSRDQDFGKILDFKLSPCSECFMHSSG